MSVIKKWVEWAGARNAKGVDERWALSFAEGGARGLKTKRDPATGIIHLLDHFDIPNLPKEAKASARLLSRAGVKSGGSVVLLAAPEDCALALIDELGAPEAEAEQALRWKMAERVDFDMSQAALEIQRAPGAEEGGLQKPSWWAAAMPEACLREQLLVLDALGARCDTVECAAFAQSGLAAMGWDQQKARALVCVGERHAALSFTANGSLLFHKRLEWSARELAEDSPASWDRLELDLVRSLDYFERRLSSVAVGEVRFAGAGAAACARAMSERVPLQCAPLDWGLGFADEAGALEEGAAGRNVWLAGAAAGLWEREA